VVTNNGVAETLSYDLNGNLSEKSNSATKCGSARG
jgi:YD repeat-containing protein